MRVETLFSPGEIEEGLVKDRTVAVIDVLRACTTIAFAMSHGCDRIIPVETVEAATKLASSLERKATLLGGEREGKRLDGFDLGNSPSEYTADVVKGKTLILTTSNGTRAIALSQGAREILIASFVNMNSVVRYIKDRCGEAVTLICAGEGNRFALEDAVCAGMLIDGIASACDCDLTDGSKAAQSLYKLYHDSLVDLLRACQHGRYLTELGFEGDLEICAQVDSLKVLPIVKDGRITTKKTRRRYSR